MYPFSTSGTSPIDVKDLINILCRFKEFLGVMSGQSTSSQEVVNRDLSTLQEEFVAVLKAASRISWIQGGGGRDKTLTSRHCRIEHIRARG